MYTSSGYLGFILLLLFVLGCAVQAPPLGGPEDTTAPKPIEDKSTPNFQTNYQGDKIELTFDEWVKLKNPGEILISPPLQYPLDIKLKGKKLTIDFNKKEVLKKDATYTVSIGEAIVDFTEGNPMDNYTFVFSTGAILDSLSLKGQVIDDYTGMPKEDVLVILYDESIDSLFETTRPYYFVKTDKSGNFTFKNLKEGTFQIFSLNDKNANYYKDQSNEEYGFLAEPIMVHDSSENRVIVPYFTPIPPLRLFSVDNEDYGKVSLLFNKKPSEAKLRFEPSFSQYDTAINGDSLLVYYSNEKANQYLFVETEEKVDTIILNTKTEDFNPPKIKINGKETRIGLELSTFDTLQMNFNQAILGFDTEKIILKDTSEQSVDKTIEINKNNKRQLQISSDWKEDVTYMVYFLDGAISGYNGSQNDSLAYRFKVNKQSDYGEFIVTLDSLETSEHYIVELSNKNLVERWIVQNQASHKKKLKGIKPGDYSIRIIKDSNKNGQWDPGNYTSKTLSEKWIEQDLNPLKADWTLEIKIDGNELR